MTTNVASWEEQRKCNNLTAQQADEILFPGNGKVGSRGAPKKAERLCAGCPVRSLCLPHAIINDLDGNWAATSKKERRKMAKVMHILVRPIEETLPPEPKRTTKDGKRISKYLIVKTEVPIHGDWLDSAVSPLD